MAKKQVNLGGIEEVTVVSTEVQENDVVKVTMSDGSVSFISL